MSRRRVEIQPKSEGRVTLTQIEKECEESMRKQLKENQHKKKLQFSFIGKRNDSNECTSYRYNESIISSYGGLPLSEIKRAKRCSGKGTVKTVSERCLKSEERAIEHKNDINKLTEEKSSQIFCNPSTMLNNNLSLNKCDVAKISQDDRIDKHFKDTLKHIFFQKIHSNDKLMSDYENKPVMNEITDCEDRDLQLLKLLYEGLNSKDAGMNDVEPLIQTLKDMAAKKIAMDMITQNLTAKTAAHKIGDDQNKMKNTNELMIKMKKYKQKRADKKSINNNLGSSPFNPNLLIGKSDNCNLPVLSQALLKFQPEKAYEEIWNPNSNDTSISDSSVNQHFESDLPLLPKLLGKRTGNQYIKDYTVFVNLIDKILGTITENKTQTSELLQDLNKKFQGTNKDIDSDKMLNDLLKEFEHSVAKVKDVCQLNKPEDLSKEILRDCREAKHTNERNVSGKIRSMQTLSQAKSDQTLSKHHSKNWSKSDELRRLQKVASELKSKIDDLLTNLEGAASDDEEEEGEDEEDDEESDDETDEEPITNGESTTLACRIANGPRYSKSHEDPYESFKRFKSGNENKTDRRKFKEYHSKSRESRLCKTIGMKPNSKDNGDLEGQSVSRNSKFHKAERIKRENYGHHDRYNIYNFKSSRKKPEDIKEQQNASREIQDNKSNLIESNHLIPQELEVYLQPHQAFDNNFDVFKLANEFKQIHRDMIDKRMESKLPQNKYSKCPCNKQFNENVYDIYSSNNKHINGINQSYYTGSDLNIKPQSNFDTSKYFNKLINELDQTQHLMNTNSPIGIECIEKNAKFNKPISDVASSNQSRRSIINLLDFFKPRIDKQNKNQDRIINKVISKGTKPITNTEESILNIIKDIIHEIPETKNNYDITKISEEETNHLPTSISQAQPYLNKRNSSIDAILNKLK